MKDRAVIYCRPRPFPGSLSSMRQVCFLIAVLFSASAPAMAQVTVNLHALDALPGSTPEAKPPPRRVPPRHVTTVKPKPEEAEALPVPPIPPPPPVAAAPATPPPPAPPAATLPAAPPPVVALAPVSPPPPEAKPTPPPPTPVSDTSATAAKPTNNGLQVVFAPGQADLSPESIAALKTVVQAAPQGDTTSFNVVAYAAGTPDDPSTARRLSLSRALAVRSALMDDGVGSARIYVRALGAPDGDKTPDRVDVAVLGANDSSASKSQNP